jgi:hypothetical protein
MWSWFPQHGRILIWLGGLSMAVCLGGLLSVPWLVARIPEDYFSAVPLPAARTAGSGRLLRWTVLIGRNLGGFALIAIGLAMVALPGPGLLTIVIGLVLVDVPGKHRLVRWLLARPPISKTINWMRERQGRPPLTPAKGTAP